MKHLAGRLVCDHLGSLAIWCGIINICPVKLGVSGESQVEHTRVAYQLRCGECMILGMSGWSDGSFTVTVYVLNRQSKHSSRSLGSCKRSGEFSENTSRSLCSTL